MRETTVRGAVSGVLFAALLSGCATSTQVADQVVKSNVAQEMASNQLLLLNIVRAYQRRPMHFTQISAIRLPVGFGNPTFTIPTPIGPDFTQQIYNLSTSVAVQQGVDTAPLNSQEFTRGITTPLPASLMLYYLDQGWPQQMVFVRTIEIRLGKELQKELVNYPENPKRFKDFQDALEGLRDCDFEAKPRYSDAQLQDIRGLAAAKAADLSLEADPKNPSSFQFVKPSKAVELTFTPRAPGDGCTLPDKAEVLYAAASADRTKGREKADKPSATFVLRSPEAMIYYLGELARAQLTEAPSKAVEDRGPAAAPRAPITFAYGDLRSDAYGVDRAVLFELNMGTDKDTIASVEYEKTLYSVPKGTPAKRSSHVLSLLTQVLGLQNKGVDLPSTATVRVIP